MAPRFILNCRFAWNAAGLLEMGYEKSGTFQLAQNDKNIVVLPHDTLQELVSIPSSIASPHGGLESDLLGPYSGLDFVLENRLHHSIIQRRLTSRLSLITPGLEMQLTSALADYLPVGREWTEFQPYQTFRKVSASLSAKIITGPEFSHNQAWLDLEIEYVENLFMTIVLLRLFPAWVRPAVSLVLPSYWRCKGHLRDAKRLLGPKLQELLNANDAGLWAPQDKNEEHINVLSWLVDSVKSGDRNPDTLAHVMVILALASVHTVLLRIVNVLYDVTANPDLLNELRAEIESVAADSRGWGHHSYDRLRKLDSVLVESQRTSPPTITGMKRLFREPYTFQNGLHVRKGSYVCMPIYAIENDPINTPDPENFDGLRQYRLSLKRREKELQDRPGDGGREFQFAVPTPTILNFGYGKAACPGRFFASLEVKMVLVKLLTEYDFRFLPGTGRPNNMMLHEFLFTLPWTKMLVRRREGGVCPF